MTRANVCVRVCWQRCLLPREIWPAKRYIYFYGICTGTSLIRCLSHSPVKFILSKNHDSQEKYSWRTQRNRTQSVTLIHTRMLKTESDGDEDLLDKEEQPSQSEQWKRVMKWALRSQADQPHVHRFTGSDNRKKQKEAPYINKDSSSLSVFTLYLTFYWCGGDGD